MTIISGNEETMAGNTTMARRGYPEKHHHGSYYRQPQQEEVSSGNSHLDVIRWFEEVAGDAAAAQAETLRRIIETNWGTEYLRKWLVEEDNKGGCSPHSCRSLQDMTDGELESLYTRLVPLASHADLDPYIQRIADGDSSHVLTYNPITTLSLSSGTTEGRPKLVPFTSFSAQSTLQIFQLAAAYRSRVLPTRPGGRVLEFIYSSTKFETKGGLIVGTATTHYYNSEEFKLKQLATKAFTCSPPEVILTGGDHKQATYCHLLLGLHHSDAVEFLTSTFAYSVVQALAALEDLWHDLVTDLRCGSVSWTRVASPKVRRAVLEALGGPNPALAATVERRCRELQAKGWRGAVPALWPNVKYVYSILTGSMLPYVPKLRYYAGKTPLVGAEYGSTESWIGVNLDPCCPPERITFAVVPTFAYFEFIPLHRRHCEGGRDCCNNGGAVPVVSEDFLESDPVPLSRVQQGQQYELVLTTYTGLYRYRLGDVVEVAGFYKGTPCLNFLCRRKLILTINIDKNTEKDLQLVVEVGTNVLRQVGAELVDFTSTANLIHRPGHYIIYWEIHGNSMDNANKEVLKQCCREMDLAFADHGYVVSRKSGSIGPLELRVLQNGTFAKILEYYITNGAAMSQFKTPRCTNNPILLTILNHNTIYSVQSTAYV